MEKLTIEQFDQMYPEEISIEKNADKWMMKKETTTYKYKLQTAVFVDVFRSLLPDWLDDDVLQVEPYVYVKSRGNITYYEMHYMNNDFEMTVKNFKYNRNEKTMICLKDKKQGGNKKCKKKKQNSLLSNGLMEE